MNTQEALLATRRHIDDALDALDELPNHTIATILTAILLTIARISVNARLTQIESEEGQNDDPRA